MFNWLKAKCQLFLPNCREAARRQSRALDQPLDLREKIGLRLHLLACSWCRRYGRQLRFLHHAAHDHADELHSAAPQGLSPEARARLKTVIQQEKTPNQ